MDEDRSQIAKALGRAGGLKTKEKYGTQHYRDLINKRWENYRKKKKIASKNTA